MPCWRKGDPAMMLAYYEGAYGPTIRLDTQAVEELRSVRRLFGRFAAGEAVEEDLCAALDCRADAIQSVTVRTAPEPPAKALELRGQGGQGPIFSWTNAPGDWLECAEKVDALLSSGSPGHQYLTAEGFDDALVELCYGE